MDNRLLKTRTWIEIDQSAILANVEAIRSLIPEGTEMMAVVKADAYGHGAVEVAGALADRVDCFGVASCYEAMELRENGIENDILILGGTEDDLFPELTEQDIMPSIFDIRSAESLSRAAVGKKAGCFLAIDTGMSRIGFPDDKRGIECIKKIAAMPNIEIRGVFSHFARADETDKTSANEQAKRFTRFLSLMEKEGIACGRRCLANSAGIMELQVPFDMVRAGIVMYGIYPSREVDRQRLGLRPALSLKTRIELIKTVPEGTGVSYGHIYRTDHETRIATLCAGYADGVPRLLSNAGSVLIHGKRAPIIGRICMDQMMVDVTDIPEAETGDTATIIGKDADAVISVDEIADLSGTISYEILCSMSRRRLPRIYLG